MIKIAPTGAIYNREMVQKHPVFESKIVVSNFWGVPMPSQLSNVST